MSFQLCLRNIICYIVQYRFGRGSGPYEFYVHVASNGSEYRLTEIIHHAVGYPILQLTRFVEEHCFGYVMRLIQIEAAARIHVSWLCVFEAGFTVFVHLAR